MEFFIRQGASDPILKMRLIDDGKNLTNTPTI